MDPTQVCNQRHRYYLQTLGEISENKPLKQETTAMGLILPGCRCIPESPISCYCCSKSKCFFCCCTSCGISQQDRGTGVAGHRSGNVEFHQGSLGPGSQGQYIPWVPSSALFIEQILIPLEIDKTQGTLRQGDIPKEVKYSCNSQVNPLQITKKVI